MIKTMAVIGLATILLAITAHDRGLAFQSTEDSRSQSQGAPVFGLEFSPDGQWLAAATGSSEEGGRIVVWRVSDWTLIYSDCEVHGGLDVAFSPDSRLVAYGTRGPHAGLIDVQTRQLMRRWEAHSSSVYSVAFMPRDGKLVTASADQSIKIWDVATGRSERTLGGHFDEILGIAVSPDGTRLLSGAKDCTAKLWDLTDGHELQAFQPSNLIVRRVAFSRDGRFVLTSRWDGKVRVRETDTGRLRAILQGGIHCADLLPDNQLLATSGSGSTAHVFRVDFRRPTPAVESEIGDAIDCLANDDVALREAASTAITRVGLVAEPQLREAMKSPDAEVRIRARRLRKHVMSHEPVAKLKGHRGDVEVVCFSPEGKLLATGCRGGDVRIWQIPEFDAVTSLPAP